MRVYFLEPAVFSRWILDKTATDHRIAPSPEQAEAIFVRVAYRVDAGMLDKLPALRVVVSPTTGIDHIDLDECARRNIDVLTLRGHTEFLENLTNTAEHAFALLLALYRRLVPAYREVLTGRWRQTEHRGYTLAGKTFGIVGYGRLGGIAARIARGFGMAVLAYDPYKEVPPGKAERVGDLKDLAARSDVVSLHAELNDLNHGMINTEVLSHAPPHSVLINTARGQLVDEHALLQALSQGRLAGAGLDVIQSETTFGNANALLNYAESHDNLLLTPHIGGQTHEAVEAADKYIYSELEQWCTRNGC